MPVPTSPPVTTAQLLVFAGGCLIVGVMFAIAAGPCFWRPLSDRVARAWALAVTRRFVPQLDRATLQSRAEKVGLVLALAWRREYPGIDCVHLAITFYGFTRRAHNPRFSAFGLAQGKAVVWIDRPLSDRHRKLHDFLFAGEGGWRQMIDLIDAEWDNEMNVVADLASASAHEMLRRRRDLALHHPELDAVLDAPRTEFPDHPTEAA